MESAVLDEYEAHEQEAKNQLEFYGKIDWLADLQKEDKLYKKLEDAYRETIGLFGANLNKDEKAHLLNRMIKNSGISRGLCIHQRTVSNSSANTWITSDPPFTSRYEFEIHGKFQGIAQCIYTPKSDLGSFIHEAVHFLNAYGSLEERLVKRDVPLANILDRFYTAEVLGKKRMQNRLLNVLAFARSETIINPFEFEFQEHSQEEATESTVIAANAFDLARKKGKEEGINYILGLYNEALKNPIKLNVKKKNRVTVDDPFGEWLCSMDPKSEISIEKKIRLPVGFLLDRYEGKGIPSDIFLMILNKYRKKSY